MSGSSALRSGMAAEERLDSLYRLVALVMLLVGIVMGIGALKFLLAEDSSALAVWAVIAKALGISGIALSAFTIFKGIRFKIEFGRNPMQVRGGFVVHSLRNAAIFAGFTAYFVLNMINMAVDEPATYPVSFYLRFEIALTNVTFGVAYLIMSRETTQDDEEREA